ncbi:MAG: methionyl-tRNA formyltransferase [Chloroflexia bacterium]|nr:methionyl-tRNA formyltransferase [Chloroflexia bacterium]
MRIVFFGSPEFAVPTLRAIAAEPTFEIALVVTQAAKGTSVVERAAFDLGLPVYKPETLGKASARASLLAAEADLFVVAAFGLILRQTTLDIPRSGSVNVHPSLLPRYRGASPVLAAIAAGDRESGVSLMVMDAGIDTGAVISTEYVAVADDDTTESLTRRLALVGAGQVVRDIPRWIAGGLAATPQPESGATLTRPLTKSDGWIEWERPAVEIERQVRAMWPRPRAWTTVDDNLLQVHRAQVVIQDASDAAPGSAIETGKRLIVATGRGALELLVVEPAGRRAMPARAYLNGRRGPLRRLGMVGAPPQRPPLVVAATDATGG